MTTRLVDSVLVRRVGLCLALVVPLAACAGRNRPEVATERIPCLSDEGTVRACLVPDRGTNNIPIGDTGCFWFRLDDQEQKKEKDRHFKRKANGRSRQFTFQVVNLCTARVEVRFDLAKTGSLEFEKGQCEPEGAREPRARSEGRPFEDAPHPHPRPETDLREIHKEWVMPNRRVSVSCDSLAYAAKPVGGKRRHRDFELVATGYDQGPIPHVKFDPEVVLEKGGNPP